MALINICSFTKTLDNGEVLEPPFSNESAVIGQEDGFTCSPKTLAVQVTPSIAVRITVDGKKPVATDRYIAANQLATFVFEKPQDAKIKTIAA